MRLDNSRESENVEDRRGSRPLMGGRNIGIGTVIIALAASYFLGVDPQVILEFAGGGSAPPVSAPAHKPPSGDAHARFVAKILAETEDTWRQIFREAAARPRPTRSPCAWNCRPTAMPASGESARIR